MQTDDQVIEDNVVRDNSVGIYLMYGHHFELNRNLLANNRGSSGYGLGLKEVNDVLVDGNRMVNNRVGVYSDGSPTMPDAPVRFRNNLFAYNESGMELLPNVRYNQFDENIFLDNSAQIVVAGEGDVLRNDWAVAGRGNYWSDYAGFDADGDQVGDLPYQSKSLFEDLLGSHPELRLFQLGPATDALDLAARAFPVFEPHVKMADPHPLTAPPALPEVPGMPEPPVAANFAVALALIALAALLLLAGLRLRWS
jgi:nitrous oxidase accessory protein